MSYVKFKSQLSKHDLCRGKLALGDFVNINYKCDFRFSCLLVLIYLVI